MAKILEVGDDIIIYGNYGIRGITKVDRLLVKMGYLDKEELKWYNPYKYYKTDTHLIRIHSCTDYFYKIL